MACARLLASGPRRFAVPVPRRRRLLGTRAAAGSAADDALGADYAFPKGLSPTQAYAFLADSGKIQRDARQTAALESLERLFWQLSTESFPATRPLPSAVSSSSSGNAGFFSSLFFRSEVTVPAQRAAAAAQSGVRGVYLYGSPGCGKTLLMDMFYRAVPTALKRRTHFHSFMLDVHARLHALGSSGASDPLAAVAADIVSSAAVMAFDEMQVTDVADAMIMRRLFQALFDRGLVVVATSNRAPRALYANGLQRSLFLPFIALIEDRCLVHDMASGTDYRALATPLIEGTTWLCPQTVSRVVPPAAPEQQQQQQQPDSSHARALPLLALQPAVAQAFDAAWARVTARDAVAPHTLTAQGRRVPVPRAALRERACLFTFAELCEQPLGAADYQVLAQHFSHVFLRGVPRLTLASRNELRRFITLIDTLYEHRVKLVAAAAAAPQLTFTATFEDLHLQHQHAAAPTAAAAAAATSSASPPLVAAAPAAAAASSPQYQHDEVFAFDRTVSRLLEMQSEEYVHRAEWRPHVSTIGTLQQPLLL